jgi:hypothetical protein
MGSSKEGLPIAKYIRSKLQGDFDCKLWSDGVFKVNKGTLETLLKEASFNDFGILIATSDDLLESRDKEYVTPRDNVIFEHGLFLGRLGISRVFILPESNSKLPSDLLGITLPKFEKSSDLSTNKSLNEAIGSLRKTINANYNLHEIGFLPSTALAIGYFQNFVQFCCDYLYREGVSINDTKYSKFEFNIVLPGEIDTDINKQSSVYCSKHKLVQYSIGAKERSRPVYIDISTDSDQTLKIFDMPTTLSSIGRCISLFLKEPSIGKSDEKQLLVARELENFKRVLQALIAEDTYSKEYVKIISE